MKKNVIKLPVELSAEEITPMLLAILNKIAYPKYSDIDGSCSRGFFMSTGKFWNFVDDYGHYASLIIQPCWMFHHK